MTMSFRSHPVFVVGAVCFGIFTDNLAYGVLVPVLPAILLQNPNVPYNDVQSSLSHMLALYGLSLLIFSPVFGYISDHYWSRRTLMLVGLFMMEISLMLLSVGIKSSRFLVAARASQGLSSAAVGVGGLALISDTVDPHNAALGMSFSIVSNFLSAAVSPFIGGVLYDHLGYYAVLMAPAGLIGLSMFLLLLMQKATTADEHHHPHESVSPNENDQCNPTWASDLPNSHQASEQDPLLEHGEGTPIAGANAVKLKKHSIFYLLRGGRMANGVVAVTICVSVFAALEITLPLFSLRQFSWSPTKTGLLLLICSAPKAVSPLAGKLVDRYGAKYPTAIAVVTSSCCMICLRFVQDKSLWHKALLIVCLALNNTAAATTETAMIAEITMVARSRDLAAQGGALVNVALASGLMLGPTIGGFMYQHFDWKGLSLSLGLMWLVCLPGTLTFAFKR